MSTSNPPSLASALAFLRSQIPTPEAGASGAPLAGPIFPLRSEGPRSPADAGQHDTQNSLRSEDPRSLAEAAIEVLMADAAVGGIAARGPNWGSNGRDERGEHTPNAGETPPSALGGTRRRDAWTPFLARTGRPAIFTPELVTEISDNIQRYGMSDTCAARNAGVSSSTISRWKQEVPQFGEFLDEARDAFELEHLHRIEVFKRKDGQCDPYCSRWLLQKGIPEKYGSASARRGRRNSEPGTPNSKHETASKKPPKPGTPEFWATVEEEPLPRNLSTCIMTPGRVKFYSTIHLVSMPYRPDIDPNEPTVHPTPEQEQAETEALFTLQEHYFSLPKEERLPYLHHVLEQEFGKVLSPEERAATDALVGGPAVTSTSEMEASRITGAVSRDCGRASSERGESSFPDPVAPTPGTSSSSSSETPENLPKTPAVAAGSAVSSPSEADKASTVASTPAVAETPAPAAVQVPTAAPPSVPSAAPKSPPPQPPAPPKRPLFRVKRRCISPDNPAWPQYQAALQREAMEEKLAEMEQLQAQGKPADSTHEAALAQYQQLVRQEQERQNRENEAFFNRPDDQDEEPVTDCF